MRPITPLVCLLALSACNRPADQTPAAAPPATEAVTAVTYVCQGGAPAEALYGDDDTLTLNYGGQTYEMNPGQATSGSVWVGQTLEWRVTLEGEGEVATLQQRNAAPGSDPIVARCLRAQSGAPLVPAPGTPTAASNACQPGALSLEVTGGDAGAGNRYTTLAFRNDGTAACTMEGYPSLVLVGGDGQPRTPFRISQETGPYYSDGRAPVVVTLEPGGRAWFELHTTAVAGEVAGETEPCPLVTAVRAGPPGAGPAAQAALELNPCNQRGSVSPLRPVEDSSPPA